MNCPKCDTELFIDREDKEGYYWYTCLNPNCPQYRKSFQPGTGEEDEATIQPREIAPTNTEDAE